MSKAVLATTLEQVFGKPLPATRLRKILAAVPKGDNEDQKAAELLERIRRFVVRETIRNELKATAKDRTGDGRDRRLAMKQTREAVRAGFKGF